MERLTRLPAGCFRARSSSVACWLRPLIGASFGAPQSGSIGEAMAAQAPAVATMKIVPADAPGTHVSWSPLTGDGSN